MTMRVDGGLNQSGGTRFLRHQQSGALMAYSLFRDAGFQYPVGVNLPIGINTSTEEPVILPVYGRLTVPQGRPAGMYTDRLIVTLEW